MNSWPKQIRIGPYTFSVHFKKKVGKDDSYGEIAYGPQEISIKEGRSPERTMVILVHEVLHGIDEYMDIGLTEKQVTRLAPGLVALLLQNKELLECLSSITSTSTTRMGDSE